MVVEVYESCFAELCNCLSVMVLTVRDFQTIVDALFIVVIALMSRLKTQKVFAWTCFSPACLFF